MVRDKSWGFTLIEISVVTGLVVVLLGATVYSLKPGSDKGSTASLAKAVSAELQNARQLAIAGGHPVAIGFSRKDSNVANSIYRLEGWNVPRITWSVSYAGDYPSLGFAVVKWGADFIEGNRNPPLSKFSLLDPVSGKAPIFGAFSIDDWIPSELDGDAIVCFTPDGGLATSKGLYSLNGRYALVVAKYLGVDDSGVIRSGSEPFAIYISENGAIIVSKDMPGLDISAGLPGEASKARLAKELAEDKEAVTLISDITVLPDSKEDGDDVDGFCTPGEQVTFLVYAQDTLGRQLFTRWKQKGPSGIEEKVGRFTVPAAEVLMGDNKKSEKEVERMEYLASVPEGVVFYTSTGSEKQVEVEPKPGGCFYSRWTWTVPLDAKPGEKYAITADVQDAKGEVKIAVPKSVSEVASPGRFIAEVKDGSRWVLMSFNRNGDKEVLLTTDPNVEEIRPSVSGTKLAFIQIKAGARYLKIRDLAGGKEHSIFNTAQVRNYTSVSLSPKGDWISYRVASEDPNDSDGTLYIARLDKDFKVTKKEFKIAQNFYGSAKGTGLEEPERTGWHQIEDGSCYAVWANYHPDQKIDTDHDGLGDLAPGGVIELGLLDFKDDDDPVKPAGKAGSENTYVIYGISKTETMVYSPSIFEPPSGAPLCLSFTSSRTNGVVMKLPIGAALKSSDNFFGYGNAEGVGYSEGEQLEKIDLAKEIMGDTGSGEYKDGLPTISSDGEEIAVVRVKRTEADDNETDQYEQKGARTVIVAKWSASSGNFETKSTATKNIIKKQIRSIVWVPTAKKG